MKESKFFEEVRAEARVEGRIEGQKNDILEALDVKFGPEARTEFTPTLAKITDPDQLARLFRQAIACRRVEDFRRQIS